MSGHSKWSTIKRQKGALDAKRGQLFTKLAKNIALAAQKGGGDPDTNFTLRLAIDKARIANMPKDNIERAIKRGTGEDKGGNYEEIVYEGYLPHGIAVLVECVTDNRNRTIAEVRSTLNRHNGSFAEGGSVAWQFERQAYFVFDTNRRTEDQVFEMALEAGADEIDYSEEAVELSGAVEAFKSIGDALQANSIAASESGLRFVAKNRIELDLEKTSQILRVIDALDELDDVQSVYSNLEVSPETAAALDA